MKKILYLFLALLLPALIFVFLKYAGKNEFEIPAPFENGVEHPPAGCSFTYATPYRLPDSLWRLTAPDRALANVLVFSSDGVGFGKLRSGIDDEFGAGAVMLADAHGIWTDNMLYEKWRKCVFLMEDPSKAVLFDGVGRIRGYYNPEVREDMDRLRVELKILLKRY